MTIAWIGWVATAVFASSYLFRRPLTLRWIQAGAALLWVAYGVAIDAVPVVVANLIVAGAALYSSFAQRARRDRSERDRPGASDRARSGGRRCGDDRGSAVVVASSSR